ncbi:hypothetical protein ABIB73_007623 [Bradyrhizobium sp. F1.4.3]
MQIATASKCCRCRRSEMSWSTLPKSCLPLHSVQALARVPDISSPRFAPALIGIRSGISFAHAKITQMYVVWPRAGCESTAADPMIREGPTRSLHRPVSRVKSAIRRYTVLLGLIPREHSLGSTLPCESVLDELPPVGVRPRVAHRQFPCLSEAEYSVRNYGVRERGAAAEQKCRNEREHHRAGRAHVVCENANCARRSLIQSRRRRL